MPWLLPSTILAYWFFGLLSVGLIVGAVAFARLWFEHGWVLDPESGRRVFEPDLGWNGPTAMLIAALVLAAWTLLGGWIMRGVARLLGGKGKGSNRWDLTDPAAVPPRGEVIRLERPDGASLHVEIEGPPEGLPVVLAHGWGVDRSEWRVVARELAASHRVIAWDLRGLGRSRGPTNQDYAVETMAGDLAAILELAGERPALIVGHSIGGMIALTYLKRHPEAARSRVAGLVLAQSTFTNPVRTTSRADLHSALERPVIRPLLHATIWLSPLVWLLNRLMVANGLAQVSSRQSGFGGTETPEMVEFVSRYNLHAWPGVLARGMLAMLEYDATAALPTLGVPLLALPGDRDPVCTPSASERIARDVPDGRLTPLPRAKHMATVEHGEITAREIATFAAEWITGGGGGLSPIVATVDRLDLEHPIQGSSRPNAH